MDKDTTESRAEEAAATKPWNAIVRSLRSRNYRLFFAGQSISLIGSWMTRVATSWLVYRLTHSAFLLGMASFVGQIPLFFLAPLAGVWIDRWDRHKVLVVTQVLSMVQSFILAALALSGIINIWELIALMLLQGCLNSFDMPARQAFVVQMVDRREDLPNAIALNSSMVNAARLVGPAIAGVVIALFGEGYCFLIDGFSFLAVIASLLAMRLERRPPAAEQKNLLEALVEGWRYVLGSVPIRSILLLLALVSLLAMPYTVLMPIFAAQTLHGGAHTMGYLMSCVGLGALAGAIALAGRQSVLGLGRVIFQSSGILGLAMVGFGLSRVLWLSMIFLLASGYGMMRQMAASNTILQTILEEGKRGRVMSFYAMAFAGMAPFGSLLGGSMAAKIGAPNTVMICGALCVICSLLYVRELPRMREFIRPIYVRLGILPELTNPELTTDVPASYSCL